jgi:hypothetical protein
MEMGKGHKEAADQVNYFLFLFFLILYLLLISPIMNMNG